MGGTVGSKENMWSHSRACIHRARLSTSFAMGPADDDTKLIRNIRVYQQLYLVDGTCSIAENIDVTLHYCI